MANAAANLLSSFGWAILHSLWIGAIVCLALFIAFRIKPTLSANKRYRIGWYALLAIVFLTSLTAWQYSNIQTFLLETISDGLVAANDNFSNENKWIGVEYKQSAERFALFDRIARTIGLASHLIGFVWALGIIVVATKMTLAWILLSGKIRKAQPLPNSALSKWNLRKSLDLLGDTVELRVSQTIRSPFVFGFLRPKIILPHTLLIGIEDKQVKSALLHEIAHVQRADPLMNLFLVAIEAGFQLNPFAIWIISFLREERECSCDHIAAQTLGDRFEYARALVDLQATFQSQDERLALGIDQHPFSRRIERLCSDSHPTFSGLLKKGCIVSTLILLACACSGFIAVVRDFDTSLSGKPDIRSIQKSLIADYSLDGNAKDLSGNHHHGEVRGCSLIPDRHGNPNHALFLNGKTDFVKILNCKTFERQSSFTATSWIKTEHSENKWMSWLAKSNLNNRRSQWRIGFGTENGEWGLTQFTHAERGMDGKASIALWASDCEIGAQWTHMTAVVNATDGWVKLYVNGKLSGKIDQVKPFIADDSPLYIGYQRDHKSYFTGAIDDVKIYGRPLTDAEVQTAYQEELRK